MVLGYRRVPLSVGGQMLSDAHSGGTRATWFYRPKNPECFQAGTYRVFLVILASLRLLF